MQHRSLVAIEATTSGRVFSAARCWRCTRRLQPSHATSSVADRRTGGRQHLMSNLDDQTNEPDPFVATPPRQRNPPTSASHNSVPEVHTPRGQPLDAGAENATQHSNDSMANGWQQGPEAWDADSSNDASDGWGEPVRVREWGEPWSTNSSQASPSGDRNWHAASSSTESPVRPGIGQERSSQWGSEIPLPDDNEPGMLGGLPGQQGRGSTDTYGNRRSASEQWQAGSDDPGQWKAGSGAQQGSAPWEFFASSQGPSQPEPEPEPWSEDIGLPPLSDATLLSRTEMEAVLPVTPNGKQANYFQPRSLSERLVQLMGSLAATMLLSKTAVLAAPALLYPMWSPWIRAGLKNVEVYSGQVKCLGLWRAQVLDVEVLNTSPFLSSPWNYGRRAPAVDTTVVRLLMGDPWEGGARVQLEFPYQPRAELLQVGESVEALVLAKDPSFRTFKVVREVYAPGIGLWLAEYPFLDRTAFLDISLQVERARQAEDASTYDWQMSEPPVVVDVEVSPPIDNTGFGSQWNGSDTASATAHGTHNGTASGAAYGTAGGTSGTTDYGYQGQSGLHDLGQQEGNQPGLEQQSDKQTKATSVDSPADNTGHTAAIAGW